MKLLKQYAMALYLGAALGLLGFTVFTWQFWAVMVPIVILAEWKAS